VIQDAWRSSRGGRRYYLRAMLLRAVRHDQIRHFSRLSFQHRQLSPRVCRRYATCLPNTTPLPLFLRYQYTDTTPPPTRHAHSAFAMTTIEIKERSSRRHAMAATAPRPLCRLLHGDKRKRRRVYAREAVMTGQCYGEVARDGSDA